MPLFQSFRVTHISSGILEIEYPIQYKVIDWIFSGGTNKSPKIQSKGAAVYCFPP